MNEILYNRLKELLPSEEEISSWLNAPNPDYDEISPQDVINQGNNDSILRYLDDADKGALT